MEITGNSSNTPLTGILRYTALLFSVISVVSGCVAMPSAGTAAIAEPVAVNPQTDRESALLALAAPLQPGQRETYNGMTVEAGQAYRAASGRVCKFITLNDMTKTDKGSTRLACRDSTRWVFVTDIFSGQVQVNQYK